MSTKYIAIASALASTAYMLNKLNGTYGSLNSQDADFKNLKTEVEMALDMPDDPAPGDLAPQSVVMSQEQLAALMATVTEQAEHSDLAVLAAIAETRQEILAAVAPQ